MEATTAIARRTVTGTGAPDITMRGIAHNAGIHRGMARL